MFEIINLLMLEDAKDVGIQKLTKHKDIYQLSSIDDSTYQLNPFKLLSYRGDIKRYLAENNIKLCYMINEHDKELTEMYGYLIKTYDKDENDNLTRHNVKPSTKKYVKTL